METSETAGYGSIAPQLNSGLNAEDSSVYTPMGISARGKVLIDRLVLACGILVSLLGLTSLLAHLLSWPQPGFLPGGIAYWVSYPISWALLFLGMGLVLTLHSQFREWPEHEQLAKSWLEPVRYIAVTAPGFIGLFYLVQYGLLARADVSLLLRSTNTVLSAAFFSSSYAFLCSLVLLSFWRSHYKEWVSVYVVGVFALFLIALSCFVGFGYIFQLPILFNYKMSFFSAVAFVIVGLAMLLGTLPYGGILLPLFSTNFRVRVLALLAVLSGVLVLAENIASIVEINRHLSAVHYLTINDIVLYAMLELTSTLTSVAVITLFLRALTYYNNSMVYATSQSMLAQREVTIRQAIQVVHSTLDLRDTFQKITDELGYQLKVDRCFIARFRDGKLMPPTQEYRRSSEVSSMLTLDIDLWERLNQFSQMVCLIPHPFEFSPETSAGAPEIQLLMRKIDLKSGIGYGVTYRGECLAALFLHQTTHERVWTQMEMDIIQVVAEQVAVAIYQAELYEKLKTSEQRFRLLVNGAREYAIYMLDPEGRISTWNEGAERISSYLAEEVLGKHFSTLFQADEMPDWYSSHILEMALSLGHYEEEVSRHRKDGSMFWVHLATSPLFDEDGKLLGYSRIMQDVTERKKVEHDLQQAKEAAELANQRKSKALTTMSHEFKTSLNAIIGYADMLLLGKATTPARMARYAKNIADSGRYLLTIVNDILDIAQAESGKMRLAPRWVDPAQLLMELDPMIRPQVEAKRVHLQFEVSPELPQAFWDPSRIKQALLNLLSNAVKYNREDGAVTVRLSVTESHDYLIVQVQDTGIGIPEDQLPNVFTEFYRVAGTSQDQPGTGLGLTLTRQLVELHGGTIEMESQEGIGSTFTVHLPVHSQIDLLKASAGVMPQLEESVRDPYD